MTAPAAPDLASAGYPRPHEWAGRRVLVTGHTGFKGAWLCQMLEAFGARVAGLALAPAEPALFTMAGVGSKLEHHYEIDIRDRYATAQAVAELQPEVIFHMAAQPLVRLSYAEPVETFATNVMGTAHVLEAARGAGSVRAIVSVTTDKCYLNREWPWAYREDEALGGRDPYSASKAGAELVTAAWRDSFLAGAGIAVASARAGNVIGGGDWADDRLVPDFYRALDHGASLAVRAPDAVRPWQHVLEPLSGYVVLAEALLRDPARFARAWNFGPDNADVSPVRRVLDTLCRHHVGAAWHSTAPAVLHEAHLLKIDSSLAAAELGWRPRWSLDKALEQTAAWYEARRAGDDLGAVCRRQIEAYLCAASSTDLV